MSQDRLLTVRDLVELLRLSRSTVIGLLARGEIESLTIRRARRIQESALRTFIEARAAQTERLTKAAPRVETGAATEAGRDWIAPLR